MAFIHDNFLLETTEAQSLYHKYAADEPILDYHSHLPPKDIAENRRFANLFEIWLEGDHYKWRAMRANGVSEPYCTGDATPYEKFLAFAKTVPYTLRNPLYHWTHLELKRYFGIDELLNESNAEAIWNKTTAMLATDELRVWGIFEKFQVKAVCTTDDPADDLSWHAAIAKSGCPAKVYPTFRPDNPLNIHRPEVFLPWLDKLYEVSGQSIDSFADFLKALRQRHDAFHAAGCRLSDHGLNRCLADFCEEEEAAEIFAKAREGGEVTPEELQRYSSFMMLFFGRLDAEKGWTKQLHLGARRSVNSSAFERLGADKGFDSIGDLQQGDALAAYLDAMSRADALPKMVLYNLNPSDNYLFATMAGNFQDGETAGKIQFGSGWWFLDQKEAMEWQMNALSNCGLFSRFIGMLTDSRSFMSFPRHEYFRRVLCNLVGGDVAKGLLPNDEELVGGMVRRICFANARDFLKLEL
ncbi:glucuronate isomerase [Bryobacter aggregatus]|uniref:glucuronate isomerase n=1 Tax=Bryobacter aggregatus TaxID=360054 RepID=UPI0004E1934F|nr:glucuronate isomerase [Bryobacter aggregatus]